jgi:ribosomal protein S27E
MIFRLLILFSFFIAIGCGGEGTKKTSDDTSSTESTSTDINTVSTDNNAQVTPITPPAEPAQNAEGVWHYTCPKGCEGGGGSAVPCSNCGTTLVHNQGYHGATNTSTQPLGQNPVQAQPKPAEPAQNANGVWHYTCPNGCSGGGGSASPCSSCGATLAHNQAYHS